MATTPEEITDPSSSSASWNLEDLVDDQGAEASAGCSTRRRKADEFAGRYAGKVAELDGAGPAEAMRALETIGELGGRAGSYACRLIRRHAGPAARALVAG